MGKEGHPRVEGQAPANVGSWNGKHPTEPTVDCGAGGSNPDVSPHPLLWTRKKES